MFLDSIFSALNVMTYWETHVAVLEYLSLFLLPVAAVCLIIKRRKGVCITYLKMLLLPALEAIAVAVFVLTLFPIMLGLGEDALWGFPLRILKLAPGGLLGLLGILMVLSAALTFVSRFVRLQSFKTLVLGTIALVFVQFFLNMINPVIEIELMDLVPGFWFILGVIAISGIFSKFAHYVSDSFTAGLGNRLGLKDSAAELLILPLTAVPGFIPLFVYGAWLS